MNSRPQIYFLLKQLLKQAAIPFKRCCDPAAAHLKQQLFFYKTSCKNSLVVLKQPDKVSSPFKVAYI